MLFVVVWLLVYIVVVWMILGKCLIKNLWLQNDKRRGEAEGGCSDPTSSPRPNFPGHPLLIFGYRHTDVHSRSPPSSMTKLRIKYRLLAIPNWNTVDMKGVSRMYFPLLHTTCVEISLSEIFHISSVLPPLLLASSDPLFTSSVGICSCVPERRPNGALNDLIFAYSTSTDLPDENECTWWALIPLPLECKSSALLVNLLVSDVIRRCNARNIKAV